MNAGTRVSAVIGDTLYEGTVLYVRGPLVVADWRLPNGAVFQRGVPATDVVVDQLSPTDRAALEDELVEIEAERGRLSRRSTTAASRTARNVLQTEFEALGLRAYEILAVLKADCDSSGPR